MLTRERWSRRLPPPVALLLGIAAIYGLAAGSPAGRFAFPGIDGVGLALFALGLGLMLAAAHALHRAHTTIDPIHPERASHLVTSGIYRYSRNPIYLGDAVILLGMVFWFGNGLGLAVVVAFVGFLDRVQVRVEERILAERFGAGYARYRAAVRRWL